MLAFEPIVIELEGVPIGKGRPRFGRGRTYTPAKTRSFETALGFAARRVMGARLPLSGPLDVSVTAFFPVPASWSAKQRERALGGLIRPTAKPDNDNILKTIDALNKVVFGDDAQAVDTHVRKFYAAHPLLRIEVRPA
jgi:Holliday junction resolvase RusA-like endonuclease